MVSVILYAGIRVDELVRLTIDAIMVPPDIESPIHLRVKGKGQKERIVYLNRTAYQSLERYLEEYPPKDKESPIFLNRFGKPISTAGVQERMRKYSEMSGISVTPHQLRHTYARRMVGAGVPLLVLSKLLGHSSIQATQRYIDGFNPHLKREYDKAMTNFTEIPTKEKKTESIEKVEIESHTPATVIRPEPEPFDGSHWMPGFPQWLRKDCLEWIHHCWYDWKPSSRLHNAQRYLDGLKYFFQWLLKDHVLSHWSDLKTSHIEAFVQAQFHEDLKAKTVKTRLDRLYGLLRYLEAHQRIEYIPRRPKIKLPDPLPRHLSEIEAIDLEDCMKTHSENERIDELTTALYYLLQHTGLRIGEALDLKVKDINFAAKQIRVGEGKFRKGRIVYLSDRAIEGIGNYLKTVPHAPEDLLLSYKNEPLKYHKAHQILCRLGKEVKIKKLGPQRLRHTFATLLLNNGMDIVELRQLMGHENINTTLIYARLADKTVERKYRTAMEQFLKSNVTT